MANKEFLNLMQNNSFIHSITGGTLGLFVGLSLMTGIEIIVWILEFIYKLAMNPTPRKRNK